VTKLGHSLISQKHFEIEVERKWIKKKKIAARERTWDWRLGAKLKRGFGFLKN